MIYQRLTTWLAPILVFTMEEVWLERNPGADSSVHLQDMPDTPAAWRDEALAAKWAKVRRVRRVVTGALEVQRQNKVIGSSLEATPVVYVGAAMAGVLADLNFDDLCITSGIDISTAPAPKGAFRLDDVADVAVVFAKAKGQKCHRCWKVLPDVGHYAHANVCGRCDGALG